MPVVCPEKDLGRVRDDGCPSVSERKKHGYLSKWFEFGGAMGKENAKYLKSATKTYLVWRISDGEI